MRPHLEPEQHLLLVGEVADDPPERRRQLLDQRRRRQDLLILGPLRVLEDVHDLQLVSSVELLLADPMEVVDRDLGAGTGAGDVKGQYVLGQASLHPRRGRVWRSVVATSKLCHTGPLVALSEQEVPRIWAKCPS